MGQLLEKGAGMQVHFLVRRESAQACGVDLAQHVSTGDSKLSYIGTRLHKLRQLALNAGTALAVFSCCTIPAMAQGQLPSFPDVEGIDGLSNDVEQYVESAQETANNPNPNQPSVGQQPGSVPNWTPQTNPQQIPQWTPQQQQTQANPNVSRSVPLSQQPVAPAEGEEGMLDAIRDPVFRLTSDRTTLKIMENSAKVIHLKDQRIASVDGHNESVISIKALSPQLLRVQAVAPGISTLTIADENGHRYSIEVVALADVRELQYHIQRLFPRSSVEATVVRDTVVLRGWVADPEHITQLEDLARRFSPEVLNQTQVAGVQRIQLRVKIMEVQRAKIRQMGFNFLRINSDSYLASTPGQLVSVAGITATAGAAPAVTITPATLANPTIAYGAIGSSKVFQGFIEALKQESLLKIWAEPVLVANNGRPAYMLAGGQFPILVPQSLGTTTIEWRDFGVRLEAVPIMLGQGRVRLQLMPEVSERDFANAVDLNGFTVPAITTRQVNTEVEMKFGETIILAGLISERETAETSKVPVFGELPWIGAAFRRVSYNEGETELVIMVTPELVSPIDPMELPAGGPGRFTDTPVDRELYIDGMLEVPKYGDECLTCQPGCQTGSCPTPPSSGNYSTPSMQQSFPSHTVPGGSMPSGIPSGQPVTPGLIPPMSTPATPPPAPAAQEANEGSAFWKTNFFKGKPNTAIQQTGASVGTNYPQNKVARPDGHYKPAQKTRVMGLFRPLPGLLGPNSTNKP